MSNITKFVRAGQTEGETGCLGDSDAPGPQMATKVEHGKYIGACTRFVNQEKLNLNFMSAVTFTSPF